MEQEAMEHWRQSRSEAYLKAYDEHTKAAIAYHAALVAYRAGGSDDDFEQAQAVYKEACAAYDLAYEAEQRR